MVDWDNIRYVFLDLDGTLLDLAYDRKFWQHLVPERWALQQQISVADAILHMQRLIEQNRGKLDWYCLDFWTQALQMDIVSLKHSFKHEVKLRQDSQRFLTWLVQEKGLTPYLVTNAHPKTLAVKFAEIPLQHCFRDIISSHNFVAPKENLSFWKNFNAYLDFGPSQTLFVDDTETVLAAAKAYGIGHLLRIASPDSGRIPYNDPESDADLEMRSTEFAWLNTWSQLMDN